MGLIVVSGLVLVVLVTVVVYINFQSTTGIARSGESCGGFVSNQKTCKKGYICDHSNSVIDAPGVCKKLLIGNIYAVHDKMELYYPDEDLTVILNGNTDECVKLNPNLKHEGCVNAGTITLLASLVKNKNTIDFTVSSLRHGQAKYSAMGYHLNFLDINRFGYKLQVTK